MGRQARNRRERRQERGLGEQVALARKAWLGKRVMLNVGRGDGLQQGMVREITDEGLVCVEGIPGVAGVVLSLGYLRLLTLAEEGC